MFEIQDDHFFATASPVQTETSNDDPEDEPLDIPVSTDEHDDIDLDFLEDLFDD